jgi:hypothetical protein
VNVVIQAMEAQGIDPGPLRATLAQKTRVAPGEGDPQKAPKGAYNKNMVLFCLREEVKRAKRYPYQFSALCLSAKLAVALRPVPIGLIRPHEIRNALMTRAMELLRDMDLIGILDDNKALALLPFTGANGAQVVRRRIMESMDGQTIEVRNVPMRVKLAVAEETFQKERTPSLPNFLGRLEAKHTRVLKP